jgi:DNA-binding CsgD family transcriptional regulator
MTAVQRSADWIDLVESAYSTFSDEVGWLERVAASAGAIAARRVVACAYDATKPDWVGIDGVAAHGVGPDVVQRMFTLSIPRESREQAKFISQFRSVMLATTQDGTLSRAVAAHYRRLARDQGVSGLTYVNATDPTHRGCLLIILGIDPRWGPAQRVQWRRAAVHVAAGLRVRRGLAGREPSRGAEAILRPDGRIEHAEAPAQGAVARAALGRSARAVDRARGRLRRKDPDEALSLWEGLVAGRWSLIDHLDTDGRRFVLARRNDPSIVDPRGLTLRERQVASYVALGHANKAIGYALGLSTSTVAGHLARARQKLGLRSLRALREVVLREEQRGEPGASRRSDA